MTRQTRACNSCPYGRCPFNSYQHTGIGAAFEARSCRHIFLLRNIKGCLVLKRSRILPGGRQFHNEQNSRRQPLRIAQQETKPTRRIAVRGGTILRQPLEAARCITTSRMARYERQIGEQTSTMFSRRQPCVLGRSLAVVPEPALEDNFAFLVVSCGFALASKSLLSSGIIWRSRLTDVS